jgi:hypothetical protein
VRWGRNRLSLPQKPERTVSHAFGCRRARCLTNFDVYPLDKAGSCGHVDVVVILRVGDDREDLGGELDGAALGVLRLGGLAGGFV